MRDMKELEEACTPEEWVTFQQMGRSAPQPLADEDQRSEAGELKEIALKHRPLHRKQ